MTKMKELGISKKKLGWWLTVYPSVFVSVGTNLQVASIFLPKTMSSRPSRRKPLAEVQQEVVEGPLKRVKLEGGTSVANDIVELPTASTVRTAKKAAKKEDPGKTAKSAPKLHAKRRRAAKKDENFETDSSDDHSDADKDVWNAGADSPTHDASDFDEEEDWSSNKVTKKGKKPVNLKSAKVKVNGSYTKKEEFPDIYKLTTMINERRHRELQADALLEVPPVVATPASDIDTQWYVQESILFYPHAEGREAKADDVIDQNLMYVGKSDRFSSGLPHDQVAFTNHEELEFKSFQVSLTVPEVNVQRNWTYNYTHQTFNYNPRISTLENALEKHIMETDYYQRTFPEVPMAAYYCPGPKLDAEGHLLDPRKIMDSIKVTSMLYETKNGLKLTSRFELTDPDDFPLDILRVFSQSNEKAVLHYVDLNKLGSFDLERLIPLNLRRYEPLLRQLAKPEVNGTLYYTC
jgi:hypothetical protein